MYTILQALYGNSTGSCMTQIVFLIKYGVLYGNGSLSSYRGWTEYVSPARKNQQQQKQTNKH